MRVYRHTMWQLNKLLIIVNLIYEGEGHKENTDAFNNIGKGQQGPTSVTRNNCVNQTNRGKTDWLVRA